MVDVSLQPVQIFAVCVIIFGLGACARGDQAATSGESQSQSAREEDEQVSVNPSPDSASAGRLPAEVEALFPEDAPFDAQVWRSIYAARDEKPVAADSPRYLVSLAHYLGGRQPVELGEKDGLCVAIRRNIELYGGTYENDCSALPLHPDYPYQGALTAPDWEELDPKLHVQVLKDYANGRCTDPLGPGTREFGFESRPAPGDPCWYYYAGYFRRLLLESRLQIQRANINIDARDRVETVYRFKLLDHSYDCRARDGSVRSTWVNVLLESDDPRALKFNQKARPGRGDYFIFQPSDEFKGRAYLWADTAKRSVSIFRLDSAGSDFAFDEECGFEMK